MGELKNKLAKGFFWMFLGGFLVQVVQFISKIFLARWISPEDFGVVYFAISIITFAGFFQDIGLSSALVQRIKNVEDAFNSTSIFVFIVSAVVSSIIFLSAFRAHVPITINTTKKMEKELSA